jgi:hypothetical protein
MTSQRKFSAAAITSIACSVIYSAVEDDLCTRDPSLSAVEEVEFVLVLLRALAEGRKRIYINIEPVSKPKGLREPVT